MVVFYYIINIIDSNKPLYWNNKYGWTDFSHSTAYKYEARLNLILPPNGNWSGE